MDDHLTLKDALLLPNNEATPNCIHVTVIEKNESKSYKDGKIVCEVIIGDDSDCCRVLVYDTHSLQMMKKDGGIIISDFIVKTGFLVVTKMTNVFGAVPVILPDEILRKAKDLVGHILTVLEASGSPKKTAVRCVEGIIVKTSPTEVKRRCSNQEEVSFKRARLRDESGSIELCMWRDIATTNLQVGDHVKVLNFEVIDCLNASSTSIPALCNKSTCSSIEVLPQIDKYRDLLDLAEDKLEDDGPDVPPITILGFGQMNVYNCCPNKACYRKKVTANYRCPKCGFTFSSSTVEKAVNGTLKVKGKPVYHFFTQEANTIRNDLHIPYEVTDEEFIPEVIKHLPVTARITANKNKITNIKIIK